MPTKTWKVEGVGDYKIMLQNNYIIPKIYYEIRPNINSKSVLALYFLFPPKLWPCVSPWPILLFPPWPNLTKEKQQPPLFDVRFFITHPWVKVTINWPNNCIQIFLKNIFKLDLKVSNVLTSCKLKMVYFTYRDRVDK